MKKQTLQEQVSRIKGMMRTIIENDDFTPNNESPKDDLAQKAQDAVQQLSPEEQEILTNFIQNNPQGFVHTVKKEVSQEKQEEMSSEMSEEDEMGDSEFEARRILHKIIQYVGVGSMIAVVPAAMFIGGGVAAALGVTALAGTMFKDAAFFKKGGRYRDHHYDAQDKAERMNEGKDQLSRIKNMMLVMEQRGDEQSSNSITSPSGNKYYFADNMPKDYKPNNPRIYFNNGGSVSVQASRSHYCEPRNDQGPYSEMEVGFPSEGTIVPDEIMRHLDGNIDAEDFDKHKSVYGYVPISIIKMMVDANGGIKTGELPPMVEVEPSDEESEDKGYKLPGYDETMDNLDNLSIRK